MPHDKLTPAAFWQRCAKHDWTYPHSDDRRVWSAGRREEAYLKDAAATRPDLLPIWTAWVSFINGEAEAPPAAPEALKTV